MRILSLSFPVATRESIDARLDEFADLRAGDYGVALFPELVVGGYQVRDLWLSRDYLDSCAQMLSSIAQKQAQWHQSLPAEQAPLWLIGAPHQSGGACYNSAYVLRKGETVAIYHKNRLAQTGVFEEHRYFKAGEELCVIKRDGMRFGVLICEDIWFDDVVSRYAEEGVDALLVLNASPFEIDKQHRREQRISIISRQRRLAVVLSNLYGHQDELTFEGISFAYNAEGKLVLRSAFGQSEISALSIDRASGLAAESDPSIHHIPSSIDQIHAVLTGAIASYIDDNGLDSAVVGVSGGVDSAVAVCLAAEALGPDKVSALMIVGPHTSSLSIELAKELCDRADVSLRSVDIGSAYQALVQVMRRCFRGRMRDIVQENIQARLRCCVLAGLANQNNALLINTTNKSEATVGYGTLYGDLAGGIAPLLDLTKQEVYQLAERINRDDEIIPQGILTRAPTAELAADQTDEKSLMPYKAIDGLLYYYLGLGLEFSDLRRLGDGGNAPFDRAQADQFCAMAMRSEYKRRQTPMSFKLSQSAYIIDRRFPVSGKPGKALLSPKSD